MKGLFIPGIPAEMFRNGSLEGIKKLMAAGKFYDIDYPTEWERDHEILKAYSDGASNILDKIRAEIEQMDFDFGDFYDHTNTIREMVIKVIDKYKAESEEVEEK